MTASTRIMAGDCLAVMRGMPAESVDAVVTDPPYGLSFMGKRWDYDVPSVEVWAECLRVLKPGGYLLAFAGTRTQHRMAVRIEDAGFEIRDMIAWVYGCLDEATEVVTERGVMPYHKTKVGDRVLCYDVEHGEYTYQPILEIVEYDYCDTAYRLIGDFGEQVVSRNHRVIVECGGREAFQLAETLEREARVPVLEDLPALQQALHDAHQGAGRPQQDVQCGLCECVDRRGECCSDAAGTTQGRDDQVRGLWDECVEAKCLAAQGEDADLQQEVQRCVARCGVGEARTQGSVALVSRVGGCTEDAHDRRVKPGVEGRPDVSQPQGCVCGSADQVRALPAGVPADGAQGWVCDGAPPCGGTCNRSATHANGMRAPHQPRCDGQPTGKPDAVRHECPTQGVRAWRGHRSAVVRVVPFHYTGKVWCLRVPTGAFVAVRNGVAFPTGNSGFPKSLDVSKAIDKAGATDAARQWEGWGTALKPALEPITVARKPLAGTVAANVLAHGTGALNIDGCRIATDEVMRAPQSDPGKRRGVVGSDLGISGSEVDRFQQAQRDSIKRTMEMGRWPANLIHDGSEEVLTCFPDAPGQIAPISSSSESRKNQNVYGAMRRGRGNEPSANSENEGVVGFKMRPGARRLDSGSAARFFYCAKATRADRNDGLEDPGPQFSRGSTRRDAERIGAERRGNHHPTVKPTALMRYLCRLVTPPGGVVLDPFMGSGSTGRGAVIEGFRFIGIEREEAYVAIARARINAVMSRGRAECVVEEFAPVVEAPRQGVLFA